MINWDNATFDFVLLNSRYFYYEIIRIIVKIKSWLFYKFISRTLATIYLSQTLELYAPLYASLSCVTRGNRFTSYKETTSMM